MAAISFSSSRVVGKADLGWSLWGKAMGAAATAFLLLFLRGYAPKLFTYVVANVLLVVAAAYILAAHARLFETGVPRRLVPMALAASAATVSGVFLLGLPPQVSVLGVSGSLCMLLGATSALLLRHSDWRMMPSTWLSLAAAISLTIVFGVRCIAVLLNESPASTLNEGSQPHVGLLVSGGLFIVACSVGFMLMLHERQRREAMEQAQRDGLTGLYNRAAFFQLAAKIDASPLAGRYAVVMIDIDHFKHINDAHGHAAGDVALVQAAKLIMRSTRGGDLAGRYGGEEFCVLLQNCEEEGARVFATRLVHDACREIVRLPAGGSVGFTLSAGYAWPAGGDRADSVGRSVDDARPVGIERMLADADKALYEAKRQGRSRAVGASGSAGLRR